MTNRHTSRKIIFRNSFTGGFNMGKIVQKNELSETVTVAKFATVQNEGNREVIRKIEHYNLDVIISVGYRVKSKRGVEFRRWANRCFQ